MPQARDDGLKAIEEYVGSLGLDAYLVGGVVRDELLGRESKDADFLVPGLDSAQLRAALAAARPGRGARRRRAAGRDAPLSADARAAGARAGRDRVRAAAARALDRPGPARLRDRRRPLGERRGRPRPPRLHRQRDRAPARRRRGSSTRSTAAPISSAGVLRTVGPRSFAEDPLRLVRGLRFVSELDLDPDAATLAQMREQAASVALVSGERIGGGLAADGMGELSKLLLGAEPAKALSLARDTGVLVAIIPAFAPAIGFRQPGRRAQRSTSTSCASSSVAADAGMPLRVRLAALLHDLGKPPLARGSADAGVAPTTRRSAAELAARRRPRRAALPERAAPARRRDRPLPHRSSIGAATRAAARRLLARHGEELSARPPRPPRGRPARQDAHGPGRPGGARAADRLPAAARAASSESPHRLADLAVDGSRPDRARLPARRRSSARRSRCSSPRSSTSPARNRARAPARAGARSSADRDRLGGPRALPRRLHDPRGRRQPGRLRLAQPRRPGATTRRGRARTGGIACARARARPRAARAQPPAAHRDREPGAAPASRARSVTRSGRDEPGLPLLALGADCVPIAIVATQGPPALAVVHAGWRGLAEGVVEAACAALGAPARGRDDRPRDRPLLLRGRARGRGALRPRPDPRGLPRPLGGVRAGARARRGGAGRAGWSSARAATRSSSSPTARSGGRRHGAQGVIGALER